MLNNADFALVAHRYNEEIRIETLFSVKLYLLSSFNLDNVTIGQTNETTLLILI